MGWETYVDYKFQCGCKIVKGYEESCGMGPSIGCKTSANIEFCQIHSQMNPPEREKECRTKCDCEMVYAFDKISADERFPTFVELYRSSLSLCSEHQRKNDVVNKNIGKYDVKSMVQVGILDSLYDGCELEKDPYDVPPSL